MQAVTLFAAWLWLPLITHPAEKRWTWRTPESLFNMRWECLCFVYQYLGSFYYEPGVSIDPNQPPLSLAWSLTCTEYPADPAQGLEFWTSERKSWANTWILNFIMKILEKDLNFLNAHGSPWILIFCQDIRELLIKIFFPVCKINLLERNFPQYSNKWIQI